MTQTALSTGTSASEHFDRAADSLRSAKRDAYAAIDSAVDGLASAYGEATPLFSRVGKQARGYAQDGMDAARQAASELRDRGQRAVDTTRDYVRDEPLKSLMIAAAVGAVVIGLVELVRVRRNR
jgi:ElaB/YqjD/DUF883 family membrane-anchored ribosome-binding protein